jgi:integrase/recombinase XerD
VKTLKLEHLIDQVMEILKERGYTKKTWELAFRNGRFSSLRHFFEIRGTDEFSAEIVDEYILEIQRIYESGQISYYRAAHLKKIARWFVEIYETGSLQLKSGMKSKIVINEYFESVMDRYLDFKRKSASVSSIPGTKSEVLHFLGFLQNEKRYSDFSQVSLKDVQDFILHTRQRRKGQINCVVYTVKYFLQFLYSTAFIENNLMMALHMPVQKAHKILAGFSHDEVDNILAQPDRGTVIGKRDYAILLLGKNTGMRAGDIIRLNRLDIDWKRDQLSVVQGKTGESLTLPLNTETETAIIDYIRNARPECDLPLLFIRQYAPHIALSRQCVTTMFIKHRAAAGISHTSGDGKSFHGLRRSIASWMLEKDVPLTTISQILGHRQINSANR